MVYDELTLVLGRYISQRNLLTSLLQTEPAGWRLFGLTREVSIAVIDVRFTPKSGH